MKRTRVDEEEYEEDIMRFVIKKDKKEDLQSMFSEMSRKMMAKMGYQEGEGLGKEGQGIVEPIKASDQKGKAGLGAENEGVEQNDNQWDFVADKLYECEKDDWFSFSGDRPIINSDWIKVGEKKLSLDKEWIYCKPSILLGVLDGKNFLNKVAGIDLKEARDKSNPYETLGKGFFMNRAAMKMVNMDFKFGMMFTTPPPPSEVLTFADVCAGPGGFSEYILWKTKGYCMGLGFTLKGPNDFKVEDLKAGPRQMFRPHYGEGGFEGDGDVFESFNQSAFKEFVMSNTMHKGVHVMMADGGFSVKGQQNIQEILSHRLYLCQCIQALNCIAQGGHFVCKLFDVFTPFSCGLIYLMSLCFRKICIFKPFTSRPANSERYLVCKDKKQTTEEEKQTLAKVISLMQETNNRMGMVYPGNTESHQMVREIVPAEVLQENSHFYNFIVKSNNFIGRLQCIALLKLGTFLMNKTLIEGRQEHVRRKCFKLWNLPDIARESLGYKTFDPETVFHKIMKGKNLTKKPEALTMTTLKREIRSRGDHVAFVLSSPSTFLLLSQDSDTFYTRKIDEMGVWETHTSEPKTLEHAQNNLPSETVLLVDMVIGNKRKDRRRHLSYHVIDILAWSGQSLIHHPFHRRRRHLMMLLQTSLQTSLKPVELIVKPCKKFSWIEEFFQKTFVGKIKNVSKLPELLIPVEYDSSDCCNNNKHHDNCDNNNNDDVVMIANTLMLLRTTKHPWTSAFSKSNNLVYYFNTTNGTSMFDRPLESLCNYMESTCLTWRLSNRTRSHPELTVPPPGPDNDAQVVTKDIFLQHIKSIS